VNGTSPFAFGTKSISSTVLHQMTYRHSASGWNALFFARVVHKRDVRSSQMASFYDTLKSARIGVMKESFRKRRGISPSSNNCGNAGLY
jgi:hypothetical protein